MARVVQPEGHGWLIFLLILILGMVVWALFYFGYVTKAKICDATVMKLPAKMSDKLYDKWCTDAGKQIFSEERIIQPPNEAEEWCVIQSMDVFDDEDYMITDEIIGWDTLEDCCVKKMTGIDVCLDKAATHRMCFTSNIGGGVVYYTIEGYTVPKQYNNQYRLLMGNLHKTYPGNSTGSVCVGYDMYPFLLKEVV